MLPKTLDFFHHFINGSVKSQLGPEYNMQSARSEVSAIKQLQVCGLDCVSLTLNGFFPSIKQTHTVYIINGRSGGYAL